ncbi:MAG: lactate utilization protein C [Gallionella sp.]
MSARENILSRIRDAQRPRQVVQNQKNSTITTIRAHLDQHPRGPLPPQISDLVSCFKERALKLSSDVLETQDKSTIPDLLAHYLTDKRLPLRGACWASLAKLPWNTAGLDMQSRPATNDDPVGVTGAFCAIAETGTLMLLSGADTPATTSLLPETHVAIVDPRRIVASMEDAWALLRKEHKQLPRAVTFVSGPSRTADIEQTVTLGAHGPYRVLLILAPF